METDLFARERDGTSVMHGGLGARLSGFLEDAYVHKSEENDKVYILAKRMAIASRVPSIFRCMTARRKWHDRCTCYGQTNRGLQTASVHPSRCSEKCHLQELANTRMANPIGASATEIERSPGKFLWNLLNLPSSHFGVHSALTVPSQFIFFRT